MQNIQARPVRDLRNKYAEIESLLENHDPVIITKNGRGTAVLLNIEDYAKIEEYQHYLYVAEKLNEAEKEAESPNAEWTDYKEVFRQLREKYHGL
ncbi:type II toxin-antitoxin system Phd/YefM family antitoxin [Leadbettera azotonutricia]|uniref:Antitoxin n=1 Tax=Leadbettera azotonutricia (strain ATCC BAA-888 / DSM 13862 / ZAS-9) TaxID=545695 RepID=F5YFC6_LEAAZ|nr:type II toxin-antitoxin system Phd/YefM family antitoxin [Leadbettera azotonutricia]AEF82554.1 prevent-host-death family protein [Leadbettera azotonutricia ZAS-9]